MVYLSGAGLPGMSWKKKAIKQSQLDVSFSYFIVMGNNQMIKILAMSLKNDTVTVM